VVRVRLEAEVTRSEQGAVDDARCVGGAGRGMKDAGAGGGIGDPGGLEAKVTRSEQGAVDDARCAGRRAAA
jgi:hypothetical protein